MAKLITITSFTNYLEAHIAKGRLEAEGIKTFLADKHYISMVWYLSDALGGIRIQVLEKDQDKAQKIISAHLNGEYEEELNQEFSSIESNSCPKCHSDNFKSQYSTILTLFLIFSLGSLGFIFPIRKSNHTCHRCEYQWKY